MMDFRPEEAAEERERVEVEEYVEKDDLQRIMTWAGMGTPRQFYLEVASKVADSDYEAELEGDVLTCYRVEKHGGFLGIGGKTTREPVLKVIMSEEGDVEVPEEPRDEEFIQFLAGKLRQH
ncbi:MAG: hypothetical protein U9R48_02805 [Chloroflexota bacterium]|nr:hypothetical protein [Chloroflexota bacterium]